ncbi:MAG: hypothetical protein LBJ92_01955 [Holosporales bacterium]|nr:hypothetical protein [Holosporales bacterium]
MLTKIQNLRNQTPSEARDAALTDLYGQLFKVGAEHLRSSWSNYLTSTAPDIQYPIDSAPMTVALNNMAALDIIDYLTQTPGHEPVGTLSEILLQGCPDEEHVTELHSKKWEEFKVWVDRKSRCPYDLNWNKKLKSVEPSLCFGKNPYEVGCFLRNP